MWKIYNEDKVELLRKTQENLEVTQKNNEMIYAVLKNGMSSFSITEEYEITEEEKKIAAYALNLCTVSISQIIDYNDLYFLEKEYDAILNNLNLEKMPKDEALLRILKQLLDVITYFRIQEGDRKILEEEYSQKMKDAIWSAVPNPSLIVTGGTPIAIAVSLASQVGIGYMNYRKEKAKIAQDKKRKEWELQRSAIEQFNGLRRELFDTAWRLAEKYEFKDEYRITERQISQYNNILLDTDDLRRYERLEYISENFKAYPPFWYYLGSAANAVYQDERYPMAVRAEYMNRAKAHFNYFIEETKYNLLREDQLVASCALELFDLIEDTDIRKELLEDAKHSSGNAFDVLQICAISYLKIGEVEEAIHLLRMLVNEDYNKKQNAQLLSRLYVSGWIRGEEKYKGEYEILQIRFPHDQCLYPWPDAVPQTEEEHVKLSEDFLFAQKDYLRNNYANAIEQYIIYLENKYSEICALNGNITSEMASLILEAGDAIQIIVGNLEKSFFHDEIKEAIRNRKDFKDMVENEADRVQGKKCVKFSDIFSEAFYGIANDVIKEINGISDMAEAAVKESALYKFIAKTKRVNSANEMYEESGLSWRSIEEILGRTYSTELKNSRMVKEFLKCIEKNRINSDSLLKKEDKIEFLVRGETKFNLYLERNRKTFDITIKEESVVAVLNDTRLKDTDLIFTTSHVYVTGWIFVKNGTEYKKVKTERKGETLLIGSFKYENPNVNIDKLAEMIGKFAELVNKLNPSDSKSFATQIRDIIDGGLLCYH